MTLSEKYWEAIAKLVNLKQLFLENNFITNVPPEILRQGWGKTIRDDGDPRVIFRYLETTPNVP